MENTEFRAELVCLVDESHPVVVGRGLEGGVAESLADKHSDRRAAATTDSNVAPLAAEGLLSSFGSRPAEFVVFPAGEVSKIREVKEHVENEPIARGLGRDTVIVALGDGVVTDLVDFMVATFTRGAPYVSLTTTLLGVADAVIGGKTAVDTSAATNLIGAFHQPAAVFVDLDRWLTLSDRRIHEGLGETVKHACITNAAFSGALEDAFVEWGLGPVELVRGDALAKFTVRRNCEIRYDFVILDVYEGDRRMGLNLSHTTGQALETTAGCIPNHGERVVIGLALQSRLGERLGYCSPSDAARTKALLRAISLPMKIPEEAPVDWIMEATAHDRKSKAGATRFVFQDGAGRLVVHNDGSYTRPVVAEDARAFLQSQV